MIETVPDLPDGVIGLVAHGEITGEDYRTGIDPALEAAYAAGHAKPNVLFELAEDFTGLAGSAYWEDWQFGIRHLTGWGRIAIVGDSDWIVRVTELVSHVVPGRVRTFPRGARDDAVAWLTSDA